MVLDPITLATLITTAVISVLTLLINLFQSFKMEHFKLNCSDCCSLSVDGEPDDCETTDKK